MQLQPTATAAVPLPAGSPCLNTSTTVAGTCATGACLGGYCCNAKAAQMGCVACAPGTGSCAHRDPGETCASSYDCGTNLCLGGCCCSASALFAHFTGSCSACRCWGAGVNASTAGACALSTTVAAATAAPAPNVTLLCNATTPISTAVHLSRLITFPASANVTDTVPLLFLPATASGNAWGADAILATAGACAALSATPGAPPCASPPRAYALGGGSYQYLGTAAELGMTAAPACTS
jgi:hypothetical protein